LEGGLAGFGNDASAGLVVATFVVSLPLFISAIFLL
jgi:hypothetical protein